MCAFGSCQMLGVTAKEGEDIFKSEDFHLERVYNAFESAYRHYAPPRPNLAPLDLSETLSMHSGAAGKA